MSTFDSFVSEVLKGVKGLATDELNSFADAAKDDAKAFLEASKANLKRWTAQLENNQLSKDEFESLVAGQADLAQLLALTQAGIGAARLQRFRDALIKLVIDKAFATFLP
jgi:hypothetical protein